MVAWAGVFRPPARRCLKRHHSSSLVMVLVVGAMIVAGIETVCAGQIAPARGDSGAGAA